MRHVGSIICAVFLTLCVTLLSGCSQRKLPPELEYRSENVRTIRAALEMPTDSIPADHLNAEASQADADSGTETK